MVKYPQFSKEKPRGLLIIPTTLTPSLLGLAVTHIKKETNLNSALLLKSELYSIVFYIYSGQFWIKNAHFDKLIKFVLKSYL